MHIWENCSTVFYDQNFLILPVFSFCFGLNVVIWVAYHIFYNTLFIVGVHIKKFAWAQRLQLAVSRQILQPCSQPCRGFLPKAGSPSVGQISRLWALGPWRAGGWAHCSSHPPKLLHKPGYSFTAVKEVLGLYMVQKHCCNQNHWMQLRKSLVYSCVLLLSLSDCTGPAEGRKHKDNGGWQVHLTAGLI